MHFVDKGIDKGIGKFIDKAGCIGIEVRVKRVFTLFFSFGDLTKKNKQIARDNC